MTDAPRFDTLAVHGPRRADGEGPLSSPVVRSATFRFPDTAAFAEVGLDRRPGDFYGRYGNPTVRAVEERLAALEGTEGALVFGSGMAAIATTLLGHLRSGDRLVATRDLYGGTHAVFSLLERCGVTVATVPIDDAGALETEVARGARLVYTETPTNPLLRVVDLERAIRIARGGGALLAVDSTFATPVNSRPASLGADLVLHSATKYLGGHADLLGGAVAGARAGLEPIERARRILGGVMDPESAWLLERSLKTLPLRVARSNESAMRIARRLESLPGVARVHYPGLPSHPDHALAARQMRGFGGVLAFEVEGGKAAAARVTDRLRWFLRAPSLGGVESLVSSPVLSSHAMIPEADRRAAGIGEGLLRLSVGVEDVEDLLEDLAGALGAR